MPHKLLLADDSVTIQRVIELTFAEEDVQVLAVGDGKHAIDRIQADRPDIVLADVGMPERDGYEVAAFIKGNPQLAHIPVLLLTGAFEPIDESRARAVGCDGVLVKPFEPQMVINRVKDLLSGRRPASPPQPPAEADVPAQGAKQAGDSLEDYFDRLDAAFANLSTEPAPKPAAGGQGNPAPAAVPASQSAALEDFASWDPDLAGDGSRPAESARAAPQRPPVTPIPLAAAPAPPPPAAPLSVHVSVTAPPSAAVTTEAAIPVAAPPPAPSPAAPVAAGPAQSQISLAEAFAALLAAEHGQAISPAAPKPAAAPGPDVVDDIVRRVLDRLQDQDVRRTVVDVAERLVREEIDRLKRANG